MPKSKVPKLRCAVGIDGCRAGWISVIRKFDGSLAWQLAPSTTEILSSLPKDAVVLIDMIIGLPKGEQSGRQCDRLARQILQPHGSRVFAAPPREALRAHSYKEACRLARQASGKAISKQCWYLFSKIKEEFFLFISKIGISSTLPVSLHIGKKGEYVFCLSLPNVGIIIFIIPS